MQKRRLILNLSLSTAVLSAAFAAAAGPVKGHVTGQEKLIVDVYSEAAKPDAHRYTWREPSPTVRQEFRALTAFPSRDICIAAISAGQAQKHDPLRITVTGGHTIPSTIVVSPQTTLSFENHDPFGHRVYLTTNDSFKAEDMAPGAHRDWTAAGAGSYEFRDTLFPSVRFTVVVDPGVVEVVYPRNGAFAFRDLPPGEYLLKAFFQGKQVGKPLTVVATKNTVELKEALNVGEENK